MQHQVPTIEELEHALMQSVVQRASLKDQVEQIEKNMAVINGQLQLLKAQEAEKEAVKD